MSNSQELQTPNVSPSDSIHQTCTTAFDPPPLPQTHEIKYCEGKIKRYYLNTDTIGLTSLTQPSTPKLD